MEYLIKPNRQEMITNKQQQINLCYVNNGGAARGGSSTLGLRPCFYLKSNIKITGGNGTSESPYTM